MIQKIENSKKASDPMDLDYTQTHNFMRLLDAFDIQPNSKLKLKVTVEPIPDWVAELNFLGQWSMEQELDEIYTLVQNEEMRTLVQNCRVIFEKNLQL